MLDSSSTTLSPPRKLAEHGLALWNSIMTEYFIQDRGGVELLMQACEAADRVAALTAKINADGEVIQGRNGPRAHPALKDELAGRSFICRTLERLGLNLEAVRSVGRPSGAAWRGRDGDE